MPIILPHGPTSAEIRVLQEFRRLTTDALPLETLKAIKHPEGALGEAPAASLVGKGFLTGEGDTFTVTSKTKDFLAIEAKPEVVETTGTGASAAASPQTSGA
ncbi:MAG: hypothetical protein ACXW2I_16935 [Burkholderiales bacterium]